MTIPAAPRTHLDDLEAESIYIFREVMASFQNPVMLYSIGKDSSVLLHLLRKAFYPGKSPIPLIEKYHERIVSLHLKDRTADGKNLPWGQGETPIREVLQLMKEEKWAFPADIELEYKVPPGSTAVAEVAKCVRYCKESLA